MANLPRSVSPRPFPSGGRLTPPRPEIASGGGRGLGADRRARGPSRRHAVQDRYRRARPAGPAPGGGGSRRVQPLHPPGSAPAQGRRAPGWEPADDHVPGPRQHVLARRRPGAAGAGDDAVALVPEPRDGQHRRDPRPRLTAARAVAAVLSRYTRAHVTPPRHRRRVRSGLRRGVVMSTRHPSEPAITARSRR